MVGFFKFHRNDEKSFLKGYLTGQILVSSPFMNDARFHSAVIYMCGHDRNGAMGFIINKPLPNIRFRDLLDQLHIKHKGTTLELPVYYGGPVEVGRGFVLHTSDYHHPSTVKINEEFAITATLEILKVIADQEGPEQSLLTLGYTGWSAGQLEQEIQENQWLVLKGTKDFVYKTMVDTMWNKAYENLGIDPHLMTLESGRA